MEEGQGVNRTDCLKGVQTKLVKFGVYPEEKIDGVPGPLTDRGLAALDAAFKALKEGIGKVSTFGGPNDTGMTPSEGLWSFPEGTIPDGYEDLFLDHQPSGTTGLGRRLNPEKAYIACRWFNTTAVAGYKILGHRMLRYAVSANGKMIICQPADWGPAAWTGRIADISPGAAKYLGVDTDDVVSVALAELPPS